MKSFLLRLRDWLELIAVGMLLTIALILLVSGLFEARSGTVVDKIYQPSDTVYIPAPSMYYAPQIHESAERYLLEIADGAKSAKISVSEDVWEQAEVGDWYDKETATLAKADGDVDGEDAQHEKGADPADG